MLKETTKILITISHCFIEIFTPVFSPVYQQSLMLTKLDPDSTYEIEVSAYSNKGDGEKSISVLAKTLPKPPDAPYVTGKAGSSSSGTDVTIKWFTAAPNILSYRLRYGKSLHNLRGRDHSKVKLKEMPFPPQTKQHLFKELGESVIAQVGWGSNPVYCFVGHCGEFCGLTCIFACSHGHVIV